MVYCKKRGEEPRGEERVGERGGEELQRAESSETRAGGASRPKRRRASPKKCYAENNGFMMTQIQ